MKGVDPAPGSGAQASQIWKIGRADAAKRRDRDGGAARQQAKSHRSERTDGRMGAGRRYRRQEDETRAGPRGRDKLGGIMRGRGERARQPAMPAVGPPGASESRVAGNHEQQMPAPADRAHARRQVRAIRRAIVPEDHATAARHRLERRP